jgi:hypothetical protein
MTKTLKKGHTGKQIPVRFFTDKFIVQAIFFVNIYTYLGVLPFPLILHITLHLPSDTGNN